LAKSLRSELKEVKGQFDHWTDTKRTLFCKGFIEQLREAWDQGIADFIFPVLGRFDNQIKGTSLFKLAILDEEDVKTVTAARGRLSEELHASACRLGNPSTSAGSGLVEWLSAPAFQERAYARRGAGLEVAPRHRSVEVSCGSSQSLPGEPGQAGADNRTAGGSTPVLEARPETSHHPVDGFDT